MIVRKIYGNLVLKGESFSFYKYDGKDVFNIKNNVITVDENENIEINGVAVEFEDIDKLI